MKANTYKKKSHKKLWISVAVIAVIILAAINCALVYVNDYYEADARAERALDGGEGVEVVYDDRQAILFMPEEIRAGLIFYPGGKVEYSSYAPLMYELAQNGIFCILVHMPCNLAVLDMDAAEGYMDAYSEVEHWYIGGHSLGGSMAAAYVGKAPAGYEGLILCAAYSRTDLSGSGLKVLSVYGSNDGVLNMEKYVKNRINLPPDFEEAVIDGGCHAYFGSYGKQEGDGEPSITNEEQIHATVDYIVNFIRQSQP